MVEEFGKSPIGEPVKRIALRNADASAAILTWGAILQDYRFAGVDYPLVLGSNQLPPYISSMEYFGAVVGPVANRISNANAVLDDKQLQFQGNEKGKTTLHSGDAGTHNKNWSLENYDNASCKLSLNLSDSEGGFPGNRTVVAKYALNESGGLEIEIAAESDAPTFFNFAHHSYWNLDGTENLELHSLKVDADQYLPTDDNNIPAPNPKDVNGTAFDFRTLRGLDTLQVALDHNYCLNGERGRLREVALLSAGSVSLIVSTTECGLQVYDGAAIDTSPDPGLQGQPYRPRSGIALEPQSWPDAPNNPDFPSIVVRPGESYFQKSVFQPKVSSDHPSV